MSEGCNLTELIARHELNNVADEIRASTKPAILMRLGDPVDPPVGCSQIGGAPDLPSQQMWPMNAQRNRYLSFILQINCAELPRWPGCPLPECGMLYFFAGDGGDDPNQLLYVSEAETLAPVLLGPEADMASDWYNELTPHRLDFEVVDDIPRWQTHDFETLASRVGEEALSDLGMAISTGSIGKLLGHAAGIGQDSREDAFLVREVDGSLRHDYERRAAMDLSPAANWVNLLQVESDRQNVRLEFGDAGYAQILIHGEDLKQKDFSRVYVGYESS